MFLGTLELSNFRSYAKKVFVFPRQPTLILGPNAGGKTNLIEAVYLLGMGKSFRAERETEMIRLPEELARVRARIIVKDGPEDLEMMLTTGSVSGITSPGKRFLVNGIARRLVDFIGHLGCVLFWPEDLELVTDSPQRRRNFLNQILVQVDREYRRSLQSYEKGIRQRNRLLYQIREREISGNQLFFWDQLLIRTGNYITQKRGECLQFINTLANPFGDFEVAYDRSLISETRLAAYHDAEIASATTLVGPHRDDLIFSDNKRDLAKFGSRGEQRLLVLWLKMAELEYITRLRGERPLLLLDDIFSELDHKHRQEIVKIAGSQQTLITTTDKHFIPDELLNGAKVIQLDG